MISANNGSNGSYVVILNLPVFAHGLLMPLEFETRHQNGYNAGLMIWRKSPRSTISNQKTRTTWMKADLQLGKRKLEGVLSMLKFANSSKRSQVASLYYILLFFLFTQIQKL